MQQLLFPSPSSQAIFQSLVWDTIAQTNTMGHHTSSKSALTSQSRMQLLPQAIFSIACVGYISTCQNDGNNFSISTLTSWSRRQPLPQARFQSLSVGHDLPQERCQVLVWDIFVSTTPKRKHTTTRTTETGWHQPLPQARCSVQVWNNIVSFAYRPTRGVKHTYALAFQTRRTFVIIEPSVSLQILIKQYPLVVRATSS